MSQTPPTRIVCNSTFAHALAGYNLFANPQIKILLALSWSLEDTGRAGHNRVLGGTCSQLRRSRVTLPSLPAQTVNESFLRSTFPISGLSLGISLFKKAPTRGAEVLSGIPKLQRAASYYQRRYV